MISFDAAHQAVHYPPDRRFRVWIKPSFIVVASCLVLLPLLLAWGQAALFGLPFIPPIPQFDVSSPRGPHGFPLWVRYSHFFNFGRYLSCSGRLKRRFPLILNRIGGTKP